MLEISSSRVVVGSSGLESTQMMCAFDQILDILPFKKKVSLNIVLQIKLRVCNSDHESDGNSHPGDPTGACCLVQASTGPTPHSSLTM